MLGSHAGPWGSFLHPSSMTQSWSCASFFCLWSSSARLSRACVVIEKCKPGIATCPGQHPPGQGRQVGHRLAASETETSLQVSLCLLFFLERQSYRGERCLPSRLTPLMATWLGLLHPKPGTSSRSPTWMKGPKHLSSPPLLSQAFSSELGWKWESRGSSW